MTTMDDKNRIENALLKYLPADSADMSELVSKVRDWATMHGACMRSRANFSKDQLQFAPFALLPSPFPRDMFKKACQIQSLINELYHKIAHSREFLFNTLAGIAEVDSFLAKLLNIYNVVHQEGISQKVSLGLVRNDVMLEAASDGSWKLSQVEVNTIAAGFGWLGPASGLIHRFTLSELNLDEHLEKLPANTALEDLTDGMHEAWKIYNVPSSAVLMIVEDVPYNICDQRFHEFELAKKKPRPLTMRRTLAQVAEQGVLDDQKRLKINGIEIAVIYFRSGYAPDQYPTENEWEARLMIERSLAIKCPSIQYHLAGVKKIQEVLSREGVLEQFFPDRPSDVARLREMFTDLYSLDLTEEGDRNTEMGIAEPEKFVLKPQREGGGNNYYGKQVAEVLIKLGRSRERRAYTLMKLISPAVVENYIVRPGQSLPFFGPTVYELGIFGVVIGTEFSGETPQLHTNVATLEVSSQNVVTVPTRAEQLPPSIPLSEIDTRQKETPILGGLTDNVGGSPPSYAEATNLNDARTGFASLPSTSSSSQLPRDPDSTIQRISKIPGYHNVGLRPIPMIPPAMNDTEDVGETRVPTIDDVAADTIDETRARDILLAEISQHWCWGLTTAKKMKILDIVPYSAYHYVVETFTERREAAWSYEPYQGQPVDPPSNGEAPDPWDICAMPSEIFKDASFVIEVPHTAEIQPCHDCSALGRKRCWNCAGSGQLRCISCNGTGDMHASLTTRSSVRSRGVSLSYQQSTQVPGRCLVCAGMGRRRCASCLGQGHLPCSTCLARGRLKFSIKITITWKVNKEETVIDQGVIPPATLNMARGKLLLDEERPRIGPIEYFADERVKQASRHLVEKHNNMFPYERILVQRHSLRALPVHAVTYEWRQQTRQYHIFGAEQRVHCPDYPQQACCGLLSYFL